MAAKSPTNSKINASVLMALKACNKVLLQAMSLHGDMHCAVQNIKKHPASDFVGGDKLLRINTQE